MGVLPVTPHLDQTDFREQSQVMRHGRLRHRERLAQVLTGSAIPRGDPLEDREAPRVGECLGNAEEVVRG
jgi:hypothetical protein